MYESTNPLKPLMDEILALSDKKQKDYGSDADPFANVRRAEELGIPAWKGSVVRMGDKWQRIQQYTRTNALFNEGFEDSLMDMAVYALITLYLFREGAVDEAVPMDVDVPAKRDFDAIRPGGGLHKSSRVLYDQAVEQGS